MPAPLTDQERALRAVPEKQLDTDVAKLCRALGWKRYHTYRSMRSPAGFPDLTLVRGTRLIFAELKTYLGTVTPEQQEWLDKLKGTFAEVYVWRPGYMQQIADTLR